MKYGLDCWMIEEEGKCRAEAEARGLPERGGGGGNRRKEEEECEEEDKSETKHRSGASGGHCKLTQRYASRHINMHTYVCTLRHAYVDYN